MDLAGVPRSPNFVDQTGSPRMLQMLFQHQAKEEQDINDSLRNGPSGKYEDWLRGALHDMTPEEIALMKTHGFTISDIYTLRNLKRGTIPVDVGNPLYRK